MEIVYYPHPTLRYKAKPIQRVDRELRSIVAEMFDLMYAARGIGLAANQVDLPLQLFIINLAGERGDGEEMVLINPVVTQPKGTDQAEEGCLSIPAVHGQVARPARVRVCAYDLTGREIDLTVDGLLARAVQHEFDHLNGVLFIDRMSDFERKQIEPDLEEFQLEFESRRRSGKMPADDVIHQQRQAFENKYC